MPLTPIAETPPSPAQPAAFTSVAPGSLAPTDGNGDGRSAATDFLQIESIVLNLDASLRVHARAHF